MIIFFPRERGVMVDNSREASVLYVHSVVSHDDGNYTCTPSNAAPASVTVTVIKSEYTYDFMKAEIFISTLKMVKKIC